MEKFLNLLKEPFIFDRFNEGVSCISSLYGVAEYFIYIIGCYMLFGITKSISITYYKHQSANYSFFNVHNLRWLFQAFMFASAVSIFLICQNLWYFIVAVMFSLMTCFPSVLYKNFIVPHCTFASLGILLLCLGLPVCYGPMYWIFCAVALIADICILVFVKQRPYDWDGESDETTKLYWVENVTILTSMAGIICAKVFSLWV